MSSISFPEVSARLIRAAGFHARSVVGRIREKPAVRSIFRYRVWLIGLVQASLIYSALVVAWLLRFNFYLPDRVLLLSAVPILITIRLGALARGGLFHGWWRYTDIDDAIALVKAIVIGSAIFVVCMRFVLGNTAFPRAVYVLEPLLSTLFLGGARVLSRVSAETIPVGGNPCRNVILIGAGEEAERTLREIARPESGYRAIACVDDDRSLIGMKIHGVSVLGQVADLPAIAAKFKVSEVLIALPTVTEDDMRRFASICGDANVQFRSVPSLQRFLNGESNPDPDREIFSEDLLGRAPVEIDMEAVRNHIAGNTVLVTGAAGTIGSELCRQILSFCPETLVCLDHNETGIFYLQMELAKQESDTRLFFCVTNLCDAVRMKGLLAEHQPSLIFHAAAYKHVPMMEMNVYEAVKNNIFGLYGLLDIAEENGCSRFVLISSDKAVNPTNVMGATKRICELMISCRPTRSMRCVSVRFGNVLGSNGSLIPILQKQLRNHEHLTITHPEITRFFMTIHEAVSLVLEACAIGNHGETLVLEMGSPIRILDLARKLIQLSGRSERDVEIQFTGLRAGEKFCEELSYPTEEIQFTSSPQIRRIRGTPQRWLDLKVQLNQLRVLLSATGDSGIRQKMREIVPEYSHSVDDLAGNGKTLPCQEGLAEPSFVLHTAQVLKEFPRPTFPRFIS